MEKTLNPKTKNVLYAVLFLSAALLISGLFPLQDKPGTYAVQCRGEPTFLMVTKDGVRFTGVNYDGEVFSRRVEGCHKRKV